LKLELEEEENLNKGNHHFESKDGNLDLIHNNNDENPFFKVNTNENPSSLININNLTVNYDVETAK